MKLDLMLINRAQDFAVAAHGPQMYGDRPYLYHLQKVAEVLDRFDQADHASLVAALLHDTLEDTATSYSDIFKAFGPEVAELVYAVTDELGRNRAERHAKTYPKIAVMPKAVTLKLADRIANVEHSVVMDKDGRLITHTNQFSMYKKEHRKFREALCAHGPDAMWAHLEALVAKEIY